MPKPWLVQSLCGGGVLAIVAAAVLDPAHDVQADYISWLSGGSYAELAAVGLAAIAGSVAITSRHVAAILPATATRRGVTTALWCCAVLLVATIVVSSKGYDEPLSRQAAHVGLGIGAMGGLAAAAVLFNRIPSAVQPVALVWSRAFFVASAGLWVASVVGRAGGPDYRGAVQLVALGCAAAWIMTVARLEVASHEETKGEGKEEGTEKRAPLDGL